MCDAPPSDIIACGDIMNKVFSAAWRFAKREAVLCIAVLLAVISMCFVPPDIGYLDYIDWDTIAQLFALMTVMKGFQSVGLFSFLAHKLLKRADSTRKIMLVLVFLPFFFSMVATNDVALITFVPFALVVLRLSDSLRLAVPLVILQTLAANLGSMLTPMGNPQNLYLYAQSGMSFGELVLTMLPYCALSAVGLFAVVMCFRSAPVACGVPSAPLGSVFGLVWPAVGFVLCMLALFDIIPPLIVAAALLVFGLIAARGVLAKVDYSLLGTFAALFIFIGNIGNIGPFRDFLSSVISGRETPVAVLASQVISNVPAALLLSGFSDGWHALVVGCNLGGLGTLIASMASLISYKEIARNFPEKRVRYLLVFTAYNVAFLAVLMGMWALLEFVIL